MNTQLLQLAASKELTLHPSLLKDYPLGTWFYFLHHAVPCEQLTQPLSERLHYVLTQKPDEELPARLAAMRPMSEESVKVRAAAWAEYEKVRALIWAEYAKACAPARAEYAKVRVAAWAEYVKVCAAAWTEYEKVRAAAWTEYEKVCAAAWAKYEKVCLSCYDCDWPEHPPVTNNSIC